MEEFKGLQEIYNEAVLSGINKAIEDFKPTNTKEMNKIKDNNKRQFVPIEEAQERVRKEMNGYKVTSASTSSEPIRIKAIIDEIKLDYNPIFIDTSKLPDFMKTSEFVERMKMHGIEVINESTTDEFEELRIELSLNSRRFIQLALETKDAIEATANQPLKTWFEQRAIGLEIGEYFGF